MSNGIAKSFLRENRIIFVDIDSHNENLRRIVASVNDDFVGRKAWLEKAASIHDLWKRRKFRLKALITGKGPLFPYHGSEFPDFLVDKDFNEVEFDQDARKKNFEHYYVLNLIRLHHSAFNSNVLYGKTDFIYECGENPYQVQENMISFVKDWYNLKTADWIDSSILGNTFGAKDLEMGIISEVSLGQKNDSTFVVLTEGFLAEDLVALKYRCAEYSISELEDFKPENSEELQEDFLQKIDEKEPIEVNLLASS